METGSRREIAVVEGRRLGTAGWALRLQSKYSTVSCVAQKRRSASSEANLGMRRLRTFTRLLIDVALPPAHVPCRDHADQGSAFGEDDAQAAAAVGLPQR